MGMWEKIKFSYDILYITDIHGITMLFFSTKYRYLLMIKS